MKSSGNGGRMPLRTILQNFLNHVETLEMRKNTGDDQYEKEFQELKLLSETFKGSPAFSCKEGEKEVNRRKNRYKDILPFDYTRVRLSEITGIPGSDYINANYIRGASGSHAYIASQGPLAHTVTDFWRMVVECDVQVIIMACNEEESGKHKCECYWVDIESESKSYGPYTVKLLKARRMCNDFNLRTMELSYINSSGESITRTVVQFHYWAWPDHGVPVLVRPLLDMVRLVRDCQASETLPLLIHCSAGCGRTGTICAIDFVWGLLRAGKLTEDFSLFELIADMRKQRVAMVQTKDQYILVHRALRELFIEQLKMIDAHPYENLDVNGHPLICLPQENRIEPSYETIFVKGNANEIDEVKEEEDVCHEEHIEEIPWTVVHYQSSLLTDVAPPLPDKKRKADGGTSDQLSPSGSPKLNTDKMENQKKSTYDDESSGSSSSKESTPSTSLERSLLKTTETDPSGESAKEDEENKQRTSPKINLVRKSSILKLRAFFEKSHSELRGDRKKISNSTRKASSFRIRESPSKSDQSFVSDKCSAEGASNYKVKMNEICDFHKPQKLSVAKGPDLLDVDTVPTESTQIGRPDSAVSSNKTKDLKPGLPVKRSKSMKVYRGFDIRMEPSTANPEPIVSRKNNSQEQVPASIDIVLSKTPSITYISSNEKVNPAVKLNMKEPDYDNLKFCVAPLTTSSLDRGKEQRQTKAPVPACGSLDRGVSHTQQKAMPTYVNVLLRNQEVANSSKLDEDTRQLLRDCQAYLLHSEPTEKLSLTVREGRSAAPTSMETKKPKNKSTCERSHSFKKAVVNPENETVRKGTIPTYSSSGRSAEANKTEESVSETSTRPAKKAHEYEAIWLSGSDLIGPSVRPATEENTDNSSGVVTKDSVFIQKSDEIRLLLSELRSGKSDDYSRVSPVVSKFPPPFPVNKVDTSASGLQPERVLSELQELVERANRNQEDFSRSAASSFTPISAAPPTALSALSTPTSPSCSRKPPYVNYPQPPPRIDLNKGPSPTLIKLTVPSSLPISNPPIIAPTPIKVLPPPLPSVTSPKYSNSSSTPLSTSVSVNSAACSSLTSSSSSSNLHKSSSTAATAFNNPSPNVGSVKPPLKTATTSPTTTKKEIPAEAPAFRPPPPYPTNLYVKLPPPPGEQDSVIGMKHSPKPQRRTPPEYKAPPPVKRPQQSNCQPIQLSQPVAPPRTKKQVANVRSTVAPFPVGPPIPTRSFASQQAATGAPGIDVDAVAAVMAAAENPSSKSRSNTTNSATNAIANKAFSKALGKFQATAASFKTKLSQFGDGKEAGSTSPTITPSTSQPLKLEREPSFIKPTPVYVGDGVTVVNTSEATTYVRKKQQYL